jgi:hypothetical protein
VGSYNTLLLVVEHCHANTASKPTQHLVNSNALRYNTTGANNTALGRLIVYYANTTGTNNTAVGSSTLRYNTTGGNNTAVGRLVLLNQNTAGCL